MNEPRNHYVIEDFNQSQSHGLFWDSEIRKKVFDLPECKNDTQKFDIYCIDNKLNPNENISIKTSGDKNIDCGDILRFYDRDKADITIILIQYRQNETHKEIKEIKEINYTEELKQILFGSITRDVIEEYVQFVKAIPKGKVSSELKTKYKSLKREMQQKYNMRINISPKVDSKNQRRVQCSIPNIDDLLSKFPHFLLSKTDTNIIRGIEITSMIKSPKRIRHPPIIVD
jgi:hypothetical protein